MESPFCGPVPAGTRLIETFGWSPSGGFARLDLHLARMARSASALGFDFDEGAARGAMTVAGDGPLRCRLTLGGDGFQFSSAPLLAAHKPWRITIASPRLSSGDPWLAHKTTQRATYDVARAHLARNVDEVLFLNERAEVCEGTITSVFVTLEDGRMVTPPLTSGLLPGILRETLIATGVAHEAVIGLGLLRAAKAIHVGNSLRGLIPARLCES